MDGARHCFSLVEQDATCPRELLQMNRSVLAIALGEHERAIAELEAIVKADAKSAIVRSSYLKLSLILHQSQALNNLAVVLLSQGQLEQVSFAFLFTTCFHDQTRAYGSLRGH
jgi:hypothetical protein